MLYRRHRDGQRGVEGYAEDYASTTFGLLELFQADGNVRWLAWADALQDVARSPVLGRGERRLVQHDRERSERAPAVEGRLRRRRAVGGRDGAPEPADADAPSSRSGANHESRARAGALRVESRRPRARGAARGCGALDLACRRRAGRDRWSIGVGGFRGAAAARWRRATCRSRSRLRSIRQWRGAKLVDHLPFIASMTAVGDAATAYVCRDFTCQAPTTTVEGLLDALDAQSTPRQSRAD